MLKIYKTERGIVLSENESLSLLENENWDSYINDDNLFQKAKQDILRARPIENMGKILAPVGLQELWACGVTYLRSKEGRQEESKDGGDFYAKVYDAERPEVFFKCTNHRISHPGDPLRIRQDSTWDVPEPELTLITTTSSKIVGYTIGNDMSSRSIEGENPLYLPQAKTWDGCASVGPCILVTNEPLKSDTTISVEIIREHKTVFSGSVTINQMKRSFEELVSFAYRECSFPNGCFLMTGTGIVPQHDFTLQANDTVNIRIDDIGLLSNPIYR